MNKQLCCIAVALSLAALSAGCSRTVSRGIDDAGVPEETKWPEYRDADAKRATTPNRDNLALIRKGMNKEDIYNLLGRPHFREMFGAREWDYLFKYQAGEETRVCRYKIIFDKDKLAGTFHWNPENCGRNFGLE